MLRMVTFKDWTLKVIVVHPVRLRSARPAERRGAWMAVQSMERPRQENSIASPVLFRLFHARPARAESIANGFILSGIGSRSLDDRIASPGMRAARRPFIIEWFEKEVHSMDHLRQTNSIRSPHRGGVVV
jgi:hypothetical protein